jgi:tRNA threonylcarbamoyladenosine biosynthesis protein TsaE
MSLGLTVDESKHGRFVSRSPAETRRIAADLVARLPARAVLALYGELGSGKTCFVQGIAAALGIDRLITSPTFTIVNEYPGLRRLVHMDLYRIRTPDEALAFGFEDYLETDGLVAIEWAERAGDLIPADALRVEFRTTPNPLHREIAVSPDFAAAP